MMGMAIFSNVNADNLTNPNRTLSGPYLGLGVSNQSVVSGAAIAGFDVLAKDRRTVTEVSGGYRFPLSQHVFIGAEVQYGALNGELSFNSNEFGVHIDYDTDSQISYGLTFGGQLSERTVLSIYALELERDFDIVIQSPFGEFTQKDSQGALRYGVVLEALLNNRWSVKSSLGRVKTGIAKSKNNITYGTQIDFGVSLNYYF